MTELRAVTERAPAKLNPYLRVLGRRRDGYHDIETIVLPLDLADTVTVRLRHDDRITLHVTGPRGDAVPHGDDNLALRAAKALVAATGERRGVDITLEKHVPVAAGLGGGSADAAATLRGLSRAWGTDLGEDRLLEVAARVGSDVPALLVGGPVLAMGRGERLVRLDAAETWWVLVTFDAGIRAADAYRWWDLGIARRFRRAPPVDEAHRALATGDVAALGTAMWNSLEAGVVRRHPSVRAALAAMRRGGFEPGQAPGDGAVSAVVSGSGPTVAGLCRGHDHAVRLAAAVGGMAVSAPAR